MRNQWLSMLAVLSAAPEFAIPHTPSWGDLRVKHTWNTVPDNWESLGAPPAGTTVDLYIALKPHRENRLIDVLYEVSDPGHQKYGSHLSKEEVAELVAPHQDTLDLFYSWLARHGVPSSSISRTHGGGWLTITGMPVSQADELLNASYQIYKYTGTNGTDSEVILRTVGYSLPEGLHPHVQMVAPTTLFASLRPPLQTPRKRSSKEVTETGNTALGELEAPPTSNVPALKPSDLRWLYRTETYVPTASPQNSLGILGFENEYPSPADLTLFMTEYREDAREATFELVQLNGGGYDPSNPGDEASVDVQYASVMAYPVHQVFYSTGGVSLWSNINGLPVKGDSYLAWLYYLLNMPDIPPTVAISYGNLEQLFPREYAVSVCLLFAQLGARGVTVLAASGDYGVGSGTCIDSSGHFLFMPLFPASCPFVTGVGGTQSYNPEVAWPNSGGGFSYYFSRPYYQDAMIPPYIQNLGSEYAGFYNPQGRGIPDIAAQANELVTIVKSTVNRGSGTSASAPIAAGIVALLNDYRFSTGKKPLGFLNPRLYGRGLAGLNDIKAGNNLGCNTNGFYAVAGWDPVTGLGTLDFERMLRVLAAETS